MPSLYDTKNSAFLELGTPFTDAEAWRMLILLPLAIPRLLIAVLAVSFVAAVNTLVAWNWPVDEPLPAQRRAWILWSKEFLVIVLWMLGFKVKVTGRENIAKAEEGGAVIVFNHISYVDAIIMMWLFAPSGVAKASVSNTPILKYVARAYQVIYFHEERTHKPGSGPHKHHHHHHHHHTKHHKKKAVAYVVAGSVTEELQKRVSDPSYCKPGGYPMTALAAEGTCSDGRGLLEFRTGAFVLGRPVLPVCIKYKINAHNPAWTQVYSEAWHLIRLLSQWRNEVEITILPPYCPSAEEVADPKLYASNVRSVMAKTMDMRLHPENHSHFVALKKLKVVVDWSGTTVLAPPGVVDADGKIDFAKHGLLK